MEPTQIKPVALCVFRNGNQILVEESYDEQAEEVLYRPLGGGMAFGEYSWETVRREIKQDLGEDIKNLAFLGQSEHVFSYQGEPGHEIIFLFEGEFVRKEPYRNPELTSKEEDGTTFRAVWKPLREFRKKRAKLHPEELLELLVG